MYNMDNMRNHLFKSTCFALLALFLVSRPVFSEEGHGAIAQAEAAERALWLGDYSTPSEKDDARIRALEGIKEQIRQLMSERDALVERYQLLQDKYSALVPKHKEYKEKYQAFFNKVQEIKKQQMPEPGLYSEVEDPETRTLLLKTQVEYLKSRVIEQEKQNQLLRLKLSELEYVARETKTTVKLHDLVQKNREVQNVDFRDDLEMKYIEMLETESRLSAQLKDFKLEVKGTKSLDTKEIKREINWLRKRAKKLRRTIDLKEREISHLKDKKFYLQKKGENQSWVLDQERAQLELETTKLTKQYEDLREQIETSIDNQEIRRKLIDQIIKIDRGNNELREKIEKLKKKANLL